jgi:VCBS repeat-containing protein
LRVPSRTTPNRTSSSQRNPDGSFTYDPSVAARQRARVKNAIGTDKFTVTVDDGHGGVKSVTVSTTIALRDQAPVAGTLEVGAPAASNGPIKGWVSASDPDGDSYSFSGMTKPTKGTVSVSVGARAQESGFRCRPRPRSAARVGHLPVDVGERRLPCCSPARPILRRDGQVGGIPGLDSRQRG